MRSIKLGATVRYQNRKWIVVEHVMPRATRQGDALTVTGEPYVTLTAVEGGQSIAVPQSEWHLLEEVVI